MDAPLSAVGAPIREAAGWVGTAAWTELRLHEVITDWLAIESQPHAQVVLWPVRADRAVQAKIWHERLPELREMPRFEFVKPSSQSVVDRLDWLASLMDPVDTPARVVGLDSALADLEAGYRVHQGVAVGPADGPVASALVDALERLRGSRALLASLQAGADSAAGPPLP